MFNTGDTAHKKNLADEISFEAVFKKFYPSLVLFARKLTGDAPAAEDIVTDVFCKLWQRQIQFPSEQSAKAFLYISTRNACINHLQKRDWHKRVHKAISASSKGISEDFVLNHIVRAELWRQVLEQVEQLPRQCRKIMRLSFLMGYSNREIAQKLQLSINTVRNQRARGIHLVRKRQVRSRYPG
jgi:RNA polymerase sigma-70 factor (family 1)